MILPSSCEKEFLWRIILRLANIGHKAQREVGKRFSLTGEQERNDLRTLQSIAISQCPHQDVRRWRERHEEPITARENEIVSECRTGPRVLKSPEFTRHASPWQKPDEYRIRVD